MRAEAERVRAELDKASFRLEASGLTAEDIALMRLAVSETLASPRAPREAFLPARAAHALDAGFQAKAAAAFGKAKSATAAVSKMKALGALKK